MGADLAAERATLETARLLLRPLTLEHLPWLVRWEADAELRDLNDEDPHPAAPEEVEATVRGWLHPDRRDLEAFGIHLRLDDRCIGWCMLAVDTSQRECRVGLTLGERTAWGRGLGTEVVEALVAYGFGALGCERVLGEVHAFNTRSIRLLERCGFRLLRVEAGAVRRGEQRHDELVYVLERDAQRV